MRKFSTKKRFLLVSAAILFYQSIQAHELYTSYSSIEIDGTQLFYTLTLDRTEIENIFDLEQSKNEQAVENELVLNLDKIYDHFEGKIIFVAAGKKIPLLRADGNVSRDDLGNIFVNLRFGQKLKQRIWKLTLDLKIFDDFGPRHTNLVKVKAGDEMQQAILTVDSPKTAFSFSSGEASTLTHTLQFFKLGIEHIVIGYDHILFLLGLIVIGGSLLNLVKIVTSFTIAHSITLALAAFQIVSVPSRIVESVIALSIMYIAVENFFVKKTDERWLITFIFGLMHGFGFANVLSEFGLPANSMVTSLLSFNLGVEIGQLFIIVLTFPVIHFITKTRWQKTFVFGLSSVILILGFMWFLERAFSIEVPII